MSRDLPVVTTLRVEDDERGRLTSLNKFVRDTVRYLEDLRDDVREAQGQIKTVLFPPGGATAAGDHTLWRWNERDTSQFSETTIGSGSGSISLGVTDGPLGRRLTVTASSVQGELWRTIKGLTLPRRYMFRAVFHAGIGGTGSDNQGAFLHTDGSDFALFYSLENVLVGALVENGARVEDAFSTSKSAPDDTGGMLHEVTVAHEQQPISGDPDFVIRYRYNATTISASDWGAFSTEDFTTFDSGWSGKTMRTVGLGFSTANSQSGTMELSELQVLKHPWDW